MRFKKLRLYPEAVEKPSLEPKVEQAQIVRITPVEAGSPIIVAQVLGEDPPSGWKQILLDGDPVYIASDDESGSFNWDTSVYTTTEVDISALFTTPLTGTTRRKYWVYLDMTNPAANGAAWTTCTIKVKVAIDGTNYRTIDKASKAKTDLASTAEPGVPIEIPSVAQNVRITMQFDVALSADVTIYYHVVQEKMEY